MLLNKFNLFIYLFIYLIILKYLIKICKLNAILMFNLMKYVIFTIVCMQIFSLQTTSKADLSSEVSSVEGKGIYYSYSDPTYYSYTPVSYTFAPSSYYYTSNPYSSFYAGSVVYPSTYSYSSYPSYWRKGANEELKLEEPKPEELKKELSKLKKEVWGKEDYSTEQIRKENKAYDSRWLIAQLKITRVLEIEDVLSQKKTELKKRLENVDQISLNNKVSKRTNSESETEADPKKKKAAKTEEKKKKAARDEECVDEECLKTRIDNDTKMAVKITNESNESKEIIKAPLFLKS